MLELFKKYINIEKGVIGALIMGLIVFYVNHESGWQLATVAALKQALYTFIFGGWLVALCENLSSKGTNYWASVLVATLTVSIITISAVYLIHSLKGTPKPLESTLVTVFIAPPGFFFIALSKRYALKKEKSRAGKQARLRTKTQLPFTC